MLIRKFILKVTNSERKILIHYRIIDCTAERTVLVITQQCIVSKLCLHLNLRRSNFSFTYSFKFTYFCIVYIYMDLKKVILFKKLRNDSQSLRLQQNIKICRSNIFYHRRLIFIKGGFIACKATIGRLKSTFLSIDTAI